MLYRLTLHYGEHERIIVDHLTESQKNKVIAQWQDAGQSTLYVWKMGSVKTYHKPLITSLDCEEIPVHVDIPKTNS